MTLATIIKNSAVFTDETFSPADLLSIANRAIARINNECSTLFTDYKNTTDTYTDFPANWQLDLISSYLSYGIKRNDASRNEAQDYLEEFQRTLVNFKNKLGTLVDKYTNGDTVNGISSAFIDADGFGGAYGIDTSNAIDKGWFGNNGNGGSF